MSRHRAPRNGAKSRRASSGTTHDAAAAFVDEGMELLALGKYAEAQARYRAAIKADPDNVDGHAGMGTALAMDEKYGDALDHLDRAAGMLNGDEPSLQYVGIHLNLVRVLDGMGLPGDAMRRLASVREWLERTEPENRSMRDGLARFADMLEGDSRAGRSRKNPGAAGPAGKSPPGPPEPTHVEVKPAGRYPKNHITAQYYVRGVMAIAAGNDDTAAACFERTIKEDSTMAEAHYLLGVIRQKAGMHQDALACFRRTVREDPDHALAHSGLAAELVRMTEYGEAMEHVDRALELEPDLASATLNKGIILLKMSNYEDAIPYFDRTLELDPNETAAFFHKAVALMFLHRYDDSKKCIECAQGMAPGDANALLLGMSSRLIDVYRHLDRLVQIADGADQDDHHNTPE